MFYRLPLAHHKHLKPTNMLERVNEELMRRTLVVRIFPVAFSLSGHWLEISTKAGSKRFSISIWLNCPNTERSNLGNPNRPPKRRQDSPSLGVKEGNFPSFALLL